MFRPWKRRTHQALIATLTIVAIAGCANPAAYNAPVAKFRNASLIVIKLTKAYLTQLNKVERDNYIYTQFGDRKQISLIEMQKQEVFSSSGIATRLEALEELSRYTELLYQLATSKSPESVKADAADLGKSVSALSTQIAGLTSADDKSFQSAAVKSLPVIGEVLKAIADQSLEAALKKAITAGAAPVNQMLDAIETDAATAFERRKAANSNLRAILVNEYNLEFQKGRDADSVKLKYFADAISAQEDRTEALSTAQLTAGIDAMKKADTALVAFANKPKPSISDVATLSNAIDAFAAVADNLAEVNPTPP